ncbi:MAG: amidohydrolase family protein [Blastocatellia bacterium]|nr:amidohydrolase family protein [Blastocatellia bacterium]
MSVRTLLLLVCVFLFPGPIAQRSTAQAPAETLALTHVNVIDGFGERPMRDATIIVRGGRIESVSTDGAALPAGATAIDLQGRWLLPGLIDAHTHIADLSAARAALASGVTTARNMGVSHFVDLGMRELHRAGRTDLPEMLAAGYHIYPHPAEGLFLDFPQLHDLMGGLSGAANVRRVTRAQLDRGVNFIKVNATDRAGQPQSDPRKQLFSEEELAAIVDEARKSNIYVAAHAHGDEGAAAAVRAGVRTIEHGTYLSRQTLELMKQRGAYLVPTVATMAEMLEPRNGAALQLRGKHMVPRLRETTALAWQMGLKMLAGTDTDYGAASNFRIAHELMELNRAGVPPIDAIRAATSSAAECFGLAQRTGSIRPGLEADLIVVERNPLDQLGNLQDVLLVINNGRVAINRLRN